MKTAPQKSIPFVCNVYRKLAPGSSLGLEDEELVSWATAWAARRATASFQWVPAVDIIPAQAAVSQSRPSSTRLASHGHAPALRSSVLRALHPAMQQDGEQRHEWQPMRSGPVPRVSYGLDRRVGGRGTAGYVASGTIVLPRRCDRVARSCAATAATALNDTSPCAMRRRLLIKCLLYT